MSDNKANDEDQQNELTFVVTTNPYDRKSAANKKRVRSVAALKSWPERRKKTFVHHDQSGSTGGFVLEDAGAASGPSRRATPKRKGSSKKVLSPLSAELEPIADGEPLFEKCTRAVKSECNCIHCRAEKVYRFGPRKGGSMKNVTLPPGDRSQGNKRTADGKLKPRVPQGDLAMLTPPESPSPSPLTIVKNEGRAEPFNCYPVPYRPWFDRILHHMLTVFAPRGWPALKITDTEGLRWEWFMTQHALSEPALFYVRLLFASGDLIHLKVLKPEISYWLQGQAIKAINEALADPNRASSDALILAVGRIAMTEAFYGDKKAANAVHRPAQKRMIDIRGGMRELPFPALVKRLMRWADSVMAMQSGTERMLEDEEEHQNFTMKQHVDVLEEWVPIEGKELRKKIKISDLLSPSPL